MNILSSVLLSIFITCSVLFILNYFLYPAFVILLSKMKHSPQTGSADKETNTSVSFIIAAYNEEKVIRKKLENCLEIDYPEALFEIIVVSDGSNDTTPDIVNEFKDKGIISLHEDARKGKSNALNRAVNIATGEIIIFSDANNDYKQDAVKQLVSSFQLAEVGCVTGSKKIYASSDRQSSQGDGLYWRYESQIKRAESSLGSITAADGEILALRKSLYEPIDPILINDDASITFNILKKGYRVIYNPDAIAYEEASRDIVDDFHVKVRMTTGGMQTLFTQAAYIFNPFRVYNWAFFLHKTLRWLAPWFLLCIFMSNLLLINEPVMLVFFTAQVAFYSLAWLGWRKRSAENISSVLYIPMYFVVMNAALFLGTCKFFVGKKSVNWRKASR